MGQKCEIDKHSVAVGIKKFTQNKKKNKGFVTVDIVYL